MISCEFEDGNKASLRHVTVDTVVIKDGKVLLVKRNKKLVEGGKWCLVGGYMERDETITEAAAREAQEESGWKVKNITLLRINDAPHRPAEDRQNVAMVFFCEADEKVGDADWESDEQRWFELDNLPSEDQIAFDHHDNIRLYQKYLKEKFPLPAID